VGTSAVCVSAFMMKFAAMLRCVWWMVTRLTSYVSGRGELHLGILIETMRREGFEFESASRNDLPR